MPVLTLNDTNLTTLWKVTARDGSGFACTTGSRAYAYAGTTYVPASLSPSQSQRVENLDASNMELVIPLSQGGATKQELLGGKWSHARITVIRYDYVLGVALSEWKGILSDVDLDNGLLKAEALDIGVLLQQPVGDLCQELCRADFGDAKCGKVPVTNAVTVSAAASRLEFSVTHVLPAAGFYNFGVMQFTAGGNSGQRREIKSAAQSGGAVVVKLHEAVAQAIAVGDALTLAEGCGGQFTTCIAKLNARRFRGEPLLPGRHKLLRFPS